MNGSLIKLDINNNGPYCGGCSYLVSDSGKPHCGIFGERKSARMPGPRSAVLGYQEIAPDEITLSKELGCWMRCQRCVDAELEKRTDDMSLDEIMSYSWEDEYRIRKFPEPKSGAFVGYVELIDQEKLHVFAKTPEEAIGRLGRKLRSYIEDCLENGLSIPLPKKDEEGVTG